MKNTSLTREFRGASSTFLGSIYIIFLIPSLLGINDSLTPYLTVGGIALACAIGTAFFALYAKLPFSVGPGIVPTSIIASFLLQGVPFSTVMGIQLITGIAFLVLVATGSVHKMLAQMNPVLKTSGQIGIGLYLFIAALGAGGITTGINVAEMAQNAKSLSFLAGLGMIFILSRTRYKEHAILIGIVVACLLMYTAGITGTPTNPFAVPHIELAWPDFKSAISAAHIPKALLLLYVIVVDVIATLETVGSNKQTSQDIVANSKLINFDRALLSSSIVNIISPFLGIPPMVPFFESLGGFMSGAKTYVAGLLIALGFVAAAFMSPLASMAPAAACGVALAYIGYVIVKYAVQSLPTTDSATPSIACVGRHLTGVAIVSTMIFQDISSTILLLFIAYPFIATVCKDEITVTRKSAWIFASLGGVLLYLR